LKGYFSLKSPPLLIGEKREENSPCGEFLEVKFPFLSRKGNFQKVKFPEREISRKGNFQKGKFPEISLSGFLHMGNFPLFFLPINRANFL